MRKLLVVLFFGFLFVFSGCGTLSRSGSLPKEDVTGAGLEIDFGVDTKWLSSSKKIDYVFGVKNSGREPIELSRENLELTSVEKLGSGESVFLRDSLEEFYDLVLEGKESLVLHQNEERTGFRGSLFIDEDYYDNVNNEGFSYVLSARYPYSTSFSNNVRVGVSSKGVVFKVLDSLSQAAPVKLVKIELDQGMREEYFLNYYIEDRGSFVGGRSVKIDEFEFLFGGEVLGDCRAFGEDSSGFKREIDLTQLVLSESQRKLIISCSVRFDEEGEFNTVTSGKFSYDYKIEKRGEVSFPKDGRGIVR